MLPVQTNKQQRLWSRNHVPQMTHKGGNIQRAAGNSYLATSVLPRTQRFQDTPASMLGRTEAYNRDERLLNQQHENPNKYDPRGFGKQLWQEQAAISDRKRHQYEWDFLTPHGAVEDVLLFRQHRNRAPPPSAYTIPIDRPMPVESKMRKHAVK